MSSLFRIEDIISAENNALTDTAQNSEMIRTEIKSHKDRWLKDMESKANFTLGDAAALRSDFGEYVGRHYDFLRPQLRTELLFDGDNKDKRVSRIVLRSCDADILPSLLSGEDPLQMGDFTILPLKPKTPLKDLIQDIDSPFCILGSSLSTTKIRTKISKWMDHGKVSNQKQPSRRTKFGQRAPKAPATVRQNPRAAILEEKYSFAGFAYLVGQGKDYYDLLVEHVHDGSALEALLGYKHRLLELEKDLKTANKRLHNIQRY